MKASRCSTACAMRTLVMLSSSLLLCQCSMPSRQAWQYIQTNGLLTYMNYSAQRQSPPLRTSSSSSQRYAANRSSTAYPRYSSAPAPSWFSWWGSGMPYNSWSSSYPQNRYYSTPAPSSDSSAYRSKPRAKSDQIPSVRIPVEEPFVNQAVANSNPPASSLNPAPTSSGGVPNAKPAADLPFGTPIPGRTNMVNSPYAGKTQLVDVSGMSTGQTVKCPYTGKLFKVPPQQQAAASKTEPRLESKAEIPAPNSEPKPGDKKP